MPSHSTLSSSAVNGPDLGHFSVLMDEHFRVKITSRAGVAGVNLHLVSDFPRRRVVEHAAFFGGKLIDLQKVVDLQLGSWTLTNHLPDKDNFSPAP